MPASSTLKDFVLPPRDERLNIADWKRSLIALLGFLPFVAIMISDGSIGKSPAVKFIENTYVPAVERSLGAPADGSFDITKLRSKDISSELQTILKAEKSSFSYYEATDPAFGLSQHRYFAGSAPAP